MYPSEDALKKVLQALEVEHRCTSKRLSELSTLSESVIYVSVKVLKAQKLIYIAGWKRSYGTKGAMGPMWSLGSRSNVQKPRSDRSEDNRRYRRKLTPVIKKLRFKKYHGTLTVWSLLGK